MLHGSITFHDFNWMCNRRQNWYGMTCLFCFLYHFSLKFSRWWWEVSWTLYICFVCLFVCCWLITFIFMLMALKHSIKLHKNYLSKGFLCCDFVVQESLSHDMSNEFVSWIIIIISCHWSHLLSCFYVDDFGIVQQATSKISLHVS